MQRRASGTGVIMAVGQKIALGSIHKHQTATVLAPETILAGELDDGGIRVIRRTTTPACTRTPQAPPKTAEHRGHRVLACLAPEPPP